MGLEVYYPQDIRNALVAAEQASNATMTAASREDDNFTQGFQSGYRAALTTIALAFGLLQSDGWSRNIQSCERHFDFLPVANGRNGSNGHSY